MKGAFKPNRPTRDRSIETASAVLAVVFGALPALGGAFVAVQPGSSYCHAVFSDLGVLSHCSERYTVINVIMALPLASLLMVTAGAFVDLRTGATGGPALLALGSVLWAILAILAIAMFGIAYGYPFAILLGLAACCGAVASWNARTRRVGRRQ